MILVANMTMPQGGNPGASEETSDAPRANLHDALVRSQGGDAVTVDELLEMPDLYDTLEQWEQFTGADLGGYTPSGLRLERDRVRWCLLTLDDRPQARNEGRLDWLTTRLAQVEARLLQ